jgi:hypothetical protein
MGKLQFLMNIAPFFLNLDIFFTILKVEFLIQFRKKKKKSGGEGNDSHDIYRLCRWKKLF